MEDPGTWQWIWLVAAVVLAVGEMSAAGSFFLLPFALGALVAAILAFVDVSVAWQWAAFIGVSAATFAALRPIARKLDRDQPTDGIGAKRLIGETATVVEDIPADGESDELGLVRVHREQWRAESGDGERIPAGTKVKVVEIKGTRAIVFRADRAPQPSVDAETND